MKLHNLAQSRGGSIAIVVAVALVVRLAYSLTSFQTYLSSDSVGYHNMAVNVAAGNGYSGATAPPFAPNYLREPGYPLFLAGVYALYDVVGDLTYVESHAVDPEAHPEMLWARVAQSIVGAATCVLFLLLLRLRLTPTASFVIAVIAAAYLPLAAFSAILLRETLQTFLVMAMSYTLARFVLAPRWTWLALFSLTWALSNLTLQVTLLAFGPLFVLAWICLRSFSRSLGYTAAATAIMLALISPWIIRTYNYYPDLRVVRSMGMSMTMETNAYVRAQFGLYKQGLIPRDTVYSRVHANLWGISDRERFNRAFSGWYEQEAAKATAVMEAQPENDPLASLKQIFSFARNCWIESLWIVELPDGNFDMGPHGVYRTRGQYGLFALSLIGFIFGYASLLGIPIFFRRLLPLLGMFTYFVLLIPLIGDEERRGLVMHPFIVLFSCLAFFYVYERLVRRRTHAEVFAALFGPSSSPPVNSKNTVAAPALAPAGR